VRCSTGVNDIEMLRARIDGVARYGSPAGANNKSVKSR
jgi:hypothetical protein